MTTNTTYPIYLFVYGTLKTGGRWNKALGLQNRKCAECTLAGHKLSDISYTVMASKKHKGVPQQVLNYPYMFPSPLSKVKGEIIRIDTVEELRQVLALENEYTPREVQPTELFLIKGELPANSLIMTFVVDSPQGTLSPRITIKNSIYEWVL
jgi:gamma-glutamylcyclotransferase (GGCT)/AIG2-like uncharacterized protein YtfP